MKARWPLYGAAATLLACSPDAQDPHCYREGEEIQPDDSIYGQRAGESLESYFGDFEGTLKWTVADETKLSLSLPYESGAPYQLGNVTDCDAHRIYYTSQAQLTTDDGAFDNRIYLWLMREVPARPNYAPFTVATFNGLTLADWQPTLASKLGISIDRYTDVFLRIELDWPVTETSPRSGSVMLNGTLELSGRQTLDKIQVATIEF